MLSGTESTEGPKVSPTTKKWSSPISASFDALFASSEMDRNRDEGCQKGRDVDSSRGEPMMTGTSHMPHTVPISPPLPPTPTSVSGAGSGTGMENGVSARGSPAPRSRSSSAEQRRSRSRSPIENHDFNDRHFKKKFLGRTMKEQHASTPQKVDALDQVHSKFHPKFRPKGKNWERNITINGNSPGGSNYPPSTSPISPGLKQHQQQQLSGRSSVDSSRTTQSSTDGLRHRASPHESNSSRPNSAASTSSGRLSDPRNIQLSSSPGLGGVRGFDMAAAAATAAGMPGGQAAAAAAVFGHHPPHLDNEHLAAAAAMRGPPFSSTDMLPKPSFGGEPQIFNPLARHGKGFPPK